MNQVSTVASRPRAISPTGLGALVAVLLSFVAAFLALAIMAPNALAQTTPCTISWDGQVGQKWFDIQVNGPGPEDDVYNWSPERYPDGTDHACFPSGSVATTDQVTTNTPTVSSFTISAGASLSVTDVQVLASENSTNAGTLNMSGDVPLTINDADSGDGGEGLTNSGTINFTPSASTALRAIVAELFTNQGMVNVDHPQASIQRSGTGLSLAALHSNQGTIDISPTNALRSIFSNFVNATGGVITGGGTMNMDQNRFEAAGNSQIAAGTDVNMTNSVFAGTGGSTATGNVDIHGNFSGGGPSTLEGTVPAGITLDVEQGVTLRSPSVTTTVNAGRINLNGNGSQLQILPNDTGTGSTSKLTNGPTGIIEFTADNPPATTGIRSITGHLENQGTLLVNDPEASFQDPGGTTTPPRLTNNGTITISSGNALRVIQNTTVTNGTDGLINGAGTVNHSDTGRLDVTGNSQIVSPVDYNLGGGADLSFGVGSTATGNLDINGSGFDPCDLAGNVPAGFSLDVQNAYLRSATSYTNAGTITLHRAVGDTFEAEVRTEDGIDGTTETLTNTGTIAATGTVGALRIAGDLINQGTITIANPNVRFESQSEARTPKFTNAASGTFTVATGGLFALVVGEASFFENAGTVQLNGTLAPGAISYTQTGGTTTLAAPSNSIGLSPGGVVALQGGTLRGTGSITGGDVQNTGGTLAPGTSPGALSLTDDYIQGPSGTLAVEVSGADPGTGHDQLVVGGTASLDGTLTVTTSGFTPTTGQEFKILDAPAPPDAPTVSGSFATVQETGHDYDVIINPTDVTLEANAPPDADGDGVPDSTDNCPTQAGAASNGGCPVTSASPPPSADDAECETAQDKLAKAKKRLKRLKQKDASENLIAKAKKKVKRAKRAVRRAC